MVRKDIFDLAGNEVLAKPLLTADYQTILPEGAVLRKEYIEKIIELGVWEVYVKEKETVEVEILKSEIKDGITEKVKNVLQQHTYRQENGELARLSEAADSIISTILEEEKVVETIFDIKERSTDIYEHSISVCSLAILTALKLHLQKEQIHDIGVGCLLHDIGLRYFVGEDLGTDMAEWKANQISDYKKHPIYGYSSLANETWVSETGKNIVLNHHERMDGSGFPLHLKEIPIECRIVNVCDAFDEMICGIACKSVKVYEAIEYLKTFRKIYFDSEVVEVFLSFTAVYPAGSRVRTNRGELAVVVTQNQSFQDRPVIRILTDKDGNPVTDEIYIDLLKVHNVFIEKAVD